ncbi:MAG: hypothetical protein Q8P56_02585 [Candidatus Uhrbacteria bacterium]|nr:hypothetical protein [Candidatus Uhrbacteria bacterium]
MASITTTLKLRLSRTTITIIDSTITDRRKFCRVIRQTNIEESMVLRGGSIRTAVALDQLYNIDMPKTVHEPRSEISLLENGTLDPSEGSAALRGYIRVTSMTDAGTSMVVLTTRPRELAKLLTLVEVRSDRRMGVITLEMDESGHFTEVEKTTKVIAIEPALP